LETALIIVELRDASGNPIAESGVTVSFTTTLGAFPNGNQTISVDTDENGLATTWLSSTVAGLAAINASIGEIPVTNGSAEIEFHPGPATELSLNVEPVIERAGDLFTVQPVVSLRDAFGNIVSFDSETEIRVAIAAGDGGNLTGTTSLQITGGVASFTDLTFGGIVGETYQLEFAAPDTDLAPAFSEPFEILAGPAQLLVFLQQPSDTAVHQTIEPPLSVALQDGFGNLISNQSDSITLSLGENPGNADLTGTSTVETIDGVATFSDLKIDRIAEGYTLIATSAAELTAVESEPFAITAGPGYAVWAEALPEGLRGEDQDPGGFGIPNILRYAFDLDPLVPEYDKLPTISIVQDETGEWLSIQFQRRTDDPSLIYTIEAGDELDAFALLENPILEIIDNQPPAETVVATDPRQISESNRRFLRVRLLGW
ncbi:MAG TPA: Ig-like domain-containing protein, partial [Opitutales bacterium]|nr:Ig-like domain-containing protein [Opitutales bacterium]